MKVFADAGERAVLIKTRVVIYQNFLLPTRILNGFNFKTHTHTHPSLSHTYTLLSLSLSLSLILQVKLSVCEEKGNIYHD